MERVLVYECISAGGLAASDAGQAAAPEADLLAQGVAMRDALAADLQRLDHVAVSCAATRHAPLPAALARVRPLHPAEHDGPAQFLARQARRHDRVWVIAPESHDLLATLAAAVGPGRWVGCDVAAIRLASSKAATRARLAAHGIAVPASWRPGEPAPPPGTPWIVKPDDGAGCVATRLHADFPPACDDLQARLARAMPSTLEAWIDGIPLSLSLLCTGGQAELLSINRQRVVARPGGLLAYHGVDIRAVPLDDPAGGQLAGLAQRIAAAVPGLAGYVGVDVVWRTAGEPVVIEINPRLTCAYVGLSDALGRNLAGDILLARHPETAPDVLH
jgi:predicted ATP-grasp superfamily ATP-dependent carboligase